MKFNDFFKDETQNALFDYEDFTLEINSNSLFIFEQDEIKTIMLSYLASKLIKDHTVIYLSTKATKAKLLEKYGNYLAHERIHIYQTIGNFEKISDFNTYFNEIIMNEIPAESYVLITDGAGLYSLDHYYKNDLFNVKENVRIEDTSSHPQMTISYISAVNQNDSFYFRTNNSSEKYYSIFEYSELYAFDYIDIIIFAHNDSKSTSSFEPMNSDSSQWAHMLNHHDFYVNVSTSELIVNDYDKQRIEKMRNELKSIPPLPIFSYRDLTEKIQLFRNGTNIFLSHGKNFFTIFSLMHQFSHSCQVILVLSKWEEKAFAKAYKRFLQFNNLGDDLRMVHVIRGYTHMKKEDIMSEIWELDQTMDRVIIVGDVMDLDIFDGYFDDDIMSRSLKDFYEISNQVSRKFYESTYIGFIDLDHQVFHKTGYVHIDKQIQFSYSSLFDADRVLETKSRSVLNNEIVTEVLYSKE